MPSLRDLVGNALTGAQKAIAMLLDRESYADIYRAIRNVYTSASQQQIRDAIKLGQQALTAVDPLGSQNRYRVGDIPIIGPRFTEVPSLTGNLRFRARGIASWVDPWDGSTQYSTVYVTYDQLVSKSRILKDLMDQALYQAQQTNYEGRVIRGFDPSTLDVSFVAFTRAF